jgi:hypothetical protein
LKAFPQSWWNWRSDYLDKHPGAATQGTRRQLNAALLNQAPRGLARGTSVWTRQGKIPIEQVLPGDYVLAQDPRTGELAYQAVLALTSPRTLQVSKLSVGGAELFCSPGQVAWIAGAGWQRVSQLTPGQALHGVTQADRLARVNPSFEIECYDLVVEEFHTFFAGEQGLLVHEATPIAPAHVALPGLSPAAVATAVERALAAR